ncbi:MAG: DUF3175 domain-containing protein [Clostridiales Family XIII bacterium]|jgi:hypothetical protein|nr:DUF3175 domain-containing protein [Clostridiales Family XIII bacterium]
MGLTKVEREAKLRRRLADMKQYENDLYDSKWVRYVIGVDEVGRGSLAGPVCAAAVVLPRDFDVLGVDDSKKVSPKGPSSGMRMLTFYINRAGKNLSASRKAELQAAKELLSNRIKTANQHRKNPHDN